MARLVATLEVNGKQSSSSSGARGSEPLVGKSPLVEYVVSHQLKGVASSDGKIVKTGKGENQPEMSAGGLLSSAPVPECDLQAECSSLPVENGF